MNTDSHRFSRWALVISVLIGVHPWLAASAKADETRFEGRHFVGEGDVEHLRMLEVSRRLMEPDAEFQNLSMLYAPQWNGLVEGPNWEGWWIQNSYGPSYCMMPLLAEPFVTFLQYSQDLWFDRIGDGKTAGAHGLVAPDGCLQDMVNLKEVHYRQGDGRVVDLHDWAMEFTAAGVLLQSELLLIGRDAEAIKRYLSKLQRAANFIETRRDPGTGLYLAGPAGNLLAPSYAGWKKTDGTYDKAYLAGLSITYIAALDRLIELHKLAGHEETAGAYARRRDLAKAALLKHCVTDEGYFLRSIDPDGTKHGVHGAAKHGYFESAPNHDAIAFRVADDALAKTIHAKIASIPQLRPHGLIIANYPGYDDMYQEPIDIWRFGHWVNGGHWSTSEARMILGYHRLGQFDDVKRSLGHMMGFLRNWRMDNPLTEFGGQVWFTEQPTNLCYDTFGPFAASLRGLFEYLYKADRLVLVPHIPPGISYLEQRDPVRFGGKRLYLSTSGRGPMTAVMINGEPWTEFTHAELTLPYDGIPAEARIEIKLGYGDEPNRARMAPARAAAIATIDLPPALQDRARKLKLFGAAMKRLGLSDSYEAAHARLAERCIGVIAERKEALAQGTIAPLPAPAAEAAAQAQLDAANRVFDGLEQVMAKYAAGSDPRAKAIAATWRDAR